MNYRVIYHGPTTIEEIANSAEAREFGRETSEVCLPREFAAGEIRRHFPGNEEFLEAVYAGWDEQLQKEEEEEQ